MLQKLNYEVQTEAKDLHRSLRSSTIVCLVSKQLATLGSDAGRDAGLSCTVRTGKSAGGRHLNRKFLFLIILTY